MNNETKEESVVMVMMMNKLDIKKVKKGKESNQVFSETGEFKKSYSSGVKARQARVVDFGCDNVAEVRLGCRVTPHSPCTRFPCLHRFVNPRRDGVPI